MTRYIYSRDTLKLINTKYSHQRISSINWFNIWIQVLQVNGHSCVNIDHYEAVGILKAAGSEISLTVVREEYPEGIVGDSYDKDVSNVSKILPPSLHTPNNDIRQNSHDQVQTPLREDHNPHLDTHQTNGIKKVILHQNVLRSIGLLTIRIFWFV